MAFCMARADSISSGRKISPVPKRSPTARMAADSESTTAAALGAVVQRPGCEVGSLGGVARLHRADQFINGSHRPSLSSR